MDSERPSSSNVGMRRLRLLGGRHHRRRPPRSGANRERLSTYPPYESATRHATAGSADRRAGPARRHGVITRAQLRALGAHDNAIGCASEQRAAAQSPPRRLRRRPPDAHHQGPLPPAAVGLWPGAVLCHLSAAVLWGLLPSAGRAIDVTVPHGGGRRRRGRSSSTDPARGQRDHRQGRHPRHHSGPDPARPGRRVPGVALERALDEAAYLRLDLRGLRASPRPARLRPGWRGAGRAHARHHPDPKRARGAHARPLHVASASRRRDVNATVGGPHVDFLWRAAAPDRRDRRLGAPTARARPSSATAAATPTWSRPAGACCGSATAARRASRPGSPRGSRRTLRA